MSAQLHPISSLDQVISFALRDAFAPNIQWVELKYPELWRDMVAAFWRENRYDMAELEASNDYVDASIAAYAAGDDAELGALKRREMADYARKEIERRFALMRAEMAN